MLGSHRVTIGPHWPKCRKTNTLPTIQKLFSKNKKCACVLTIFMSQTGHPTFTVKVLEKRKYFVPDVVGVGSVDKLHYGCV